MSYNSQFDEEKEESKLINSNRFLSIIPKVFAKIKDFQLLFKAIDEEQNEIEEYTQTIVNNQFVDTCDLNTIKLHEQLLGIKENDNLSLEERRLGVKLAYQTVLPFTLPKLKEELNTIVGRGNYRVECIYNEYKLDIEIKVNLSKVYGPLSSKFSKLIPAHIEWSLANKILVNPIAPTDEYFASFNNNIKNYQMDLWWTDFKDPVVDPQPTDSNISINFSNIKHYVINYIPDKILYTQAKGEENSSIINCMIKKYDISYEKDLTINLDKVIINNSVYGNKINHYNSIIEEGDY